MNLELIGWIAAWLIVSEIISIITRFKDGNKSWIPQKLLSFWFGIIFMFVQIFVVASKGESIFPFHYDYLFWELGIIIAILALFGVNWLIVKLIEWIKKKFQNE